MEFPTRKIAEGCYKDACDPSLLPIDMVCQGSYGSHQSCSLDVMTQFP